MKRLAAVLTVLIFALEANIYSAIEGSDHDLTGTGAKLCQTCHIPHNALGLSLWSTATSGVFAGVADLCYSCHDGSITNTGLTTVFDLTKEQHSMVGSDCSSSNGCHDIHNQNPNLTGRFLAKGVEKTNNSYCETCHDDTPFEGAQPFGVHNTENSHYTDGSNFICESCHTVHGAVKQTVNPLGLTRPLLLADDNTGNRYGEFCISCHNGIAPSPAVPGTGGVASADVFDYSEKTNDGTQSKHSTIEGCNLCHVPMCADAPALELFDLHQDNTNSAYCVNCHSSGKAPHVGDNTHFSQDIPNDPAMNNGLATPLPWSNELDEDGVPGPDWISATNNMMICETCHSVHRKGYSGLESGHLLRYPSDGANTLCQSCHTRN